MLEEYLEFLWLRQLQMKPLVRDEYKLLLSHICALNAMDVELTPQ
jgi:hypothetical protein